LDEKALIGKLRRIEALYAGATTDGERAAAANAIEHILERLRQVEREDPPGEYQFSLPDPWTRKLFLALARRYKLKPYRYRRQRRSTVLLWVSERFVDETLWPEFEALSDTLREYLSEVTERVIAEALDGETGEATERAPVRSIRRD